eukprot:Selendium_serpulae@DN9575_c0_g1_i1.p2
MVFSCLCLAGLRMSCLSPQKNVRPTYVSVRLFGHCLSVCPATVLLFCSCLAVVSLPASLQVLLCRQLAVLQNQSVAKLPARGRATLSVLQVLGSATRLRVSPPRPLVAPRCAVARPPMYSALI